MWNTAQKTITYLVGKQIRNFAYIHTSGIFNESPVFCQVEMASGVLLNSPNADAVVFTRSQINWKDEIILASVNKKVANRKWRTSLIFEVVKTYHPLAGWTKSCGSPRDGRFTVSVRRNADVIQYPDCDVTVVKERHLYILGQNHLGHMVDNLQSRITITSIISERLAVKNGCFQQVIEQYQATGRLTVSIDRNDSRKLIQEPDLYPFGSRSAVADDDNQLVTIS
jgi:hypothetical protein